MKTCLFRHFSFIVVLATAVAFSNVFAQQVVQGRTSLPPKYNPKKGVPAQVHDEAMRLAYRDAVLREISTMISKEAFEKRRADIESRILPAAMAYRKDEEVISANPEGQDYVVTLKVTLDKDQLKKDLEGIGVSTDAGTRKTVMLLIDEYFARDFKPPEGPQIARELDITDNKDVTDINARSSSASFKADVQAGAEAETLKAKEQSSASESHQAAASGSAKISDRSGESAKQQFQGKASGSQQQSSSSSVDAASASAYYSESQRAKSSSSKYSEQVDKSQFSLRLREYFPPEMNKMKMPESATAAEMGKAMLSADIHLSDRQYVDQLRAQTLGTDGFLADYLADESKVAQAALLANQKFGADVLVIGVVNIIYNGKDKDNMENCVANLAVKVVDAGSGTILASTVASQGGLSTDAQNAAIVSARRLGSVIGPDLTDQIVTYWKKRSDKGDDYVLRVAGINQTMLKLKFMDLFKTMDKVKAVNERLFDRENGLLEVGVTFVGTPSEFKETVLRSAYALPEFQKLEEQASQGNTVNLVLEP